MKSILWSSTVVKFRHTYKMADGRVKSDCCSLCFSRIYQPKHSEFNVNCKALKCELKKIQEKLKSAQHIIELAVKEIHHHHVPEGLGVLSCSLILKMKLVPPPLPWSSRMPSSFWSIL